MTKLEIMRENDELQKSIDRLHNLLRECLIEFEKTYPMNGGTPPVLIQKIEGEGIII